jgi:hypothetical protein
MRPIFPSHLILDMIILIVIILKYILSRSGHECQQRKHSYQLIFYEHKWLEIISVLRGLKYSHEGQSCTSISRAMSLSLILVLTASAAALCVILYL